MVMSVSIFYLGVHTLLVVERPNRAVEQPKKLRDFLTEDQIVHLQGLVDNSSIDHNWIQHVFIPRLRSDLYYINFLEKRWRDIDLEAPKYARHRGRYEREREKQFTAIAERRAGAFERALHSNLFERAERELETIHRTLLTGEVEEKPIGVARYVVENIIIFIPRGIATTAKTFSAGGFGEHPMKSLAEITVAIPAIIALVRLTLRILKQIVLPFIFSMPKVLWVFILARVRDLGKAIRDEK